MISKEYLINLNKEKDKHILDRLIDASPNIRHVLDEIKSEIEKFILYNRFDNYFSYTIKFDVLNSIYDVAGMNNEECCAYINNRYNHGNKYEKMWTFILENYLEDIKFELTYEMNDYMLVVIDINQFIE